MDLVDYIITGAANILFLLSLGPWGTKWRLPWRLSSKMKSEVLESVRTHCSKIFLVFFFFYWKDDRKSHLTFWSIADGKWFRACDLRTSGPFTGEEVTPQGEGAYLLSPQLPQLVPTRPRSVFCCTAWCVGTSIMSLVWGRRKKGTNVCNKVTSWFSWKREPWSGLSVPCGLYSHI